MLVERDKFARVLHHVTWRGFRRGASAGWNRERVPFEVETAACVTLLVLAGKLWDEARLGIHTAE